MGRQVRKFLQVRVYLQEKIEPFRNRRMNRTKEIYGNCRVYHPDGSLMFLCVEKRINWYLSRNLGEVICEKPLSIKLNFEPNGKGAYDSKYDENERMYLLGTKRNVCVVCGSEDLSSLTKHHVVPHEYRKFFPVEIKSRSPHDIVPICRKHHSIYENEHANKLKRKLEKELGIDPANSVYSGMKTIARAVAFAKIIMDPDRVLSIPLPKIEYFMSEIRKYFGEAPLTEIAEINMRVTSREMVEEVAKKVIEGMTENDINNFIKMWRTDFIMSMNPQFLPEGWSITHGIK